MQLSRNEISAATKLGIAPKATLKLLGDNEGGVLLKLDTGEMFTVNDTTVAFLRELDGNTSLEEVTARLCEVFEVEQDVLQADLAEIADDLMDNDLIRKV